MALGMHFGENPNGFGEMGLWISGFFCFVLSKFIHCLVWVSEEERESGAERESVFWDLHFLFSFWPFCCWPSGVLWRERQRERVQAVR